MKDSVELEHQIKERWNQANAERNILYRAETLTTGTVTHEGITLSLIHNSCRDSYDLSPKSIDDPAIVTMPFYDVSNPELARTADGYFKILGNKFSCIQYQCILAPTQPVETLTVDFLKMSLRFATKHPSLTLMYNAMNAGKTVPLQYWLLSFHAYDLLCTSNENAQELGIVKGISMTKRHIPCYMLILSFNNDIEATASLLFALATYVELKSFNLFLYSNKAFFIPREDVEIPSGFLNHRFGGLEMVGCFIMKSIEQLQATNPVTLFNAIQEISYKPVKQKKLESYLHQMLS